MYRAVLSVPTYDILRYRAVPSIPVLYRTVACLKGEQEVRKPWWAPSCLSVVFVRLAKRNRQSRVVSMKLEP
ncbi:hypothetical protein BHM03_00008578 [Ensete ventricosum]|nr:hypothetical protein BHM03_00008578 [Ensete ventricosum]